MGKGKKKKKQAQEKYIPEIIEAVDSKGRDTWYFALIDAEHHKAYEEARDKGQVEIKKNDEDILFVCLNGDKCGQVIDSGHGAPSQEQKDAFIKEHGIPVLEEEPPDDKTEEKPDAGSEGNRRDTIKPEYKP